MQSIFNFSIFPANTHNVCRTHKYTDTCAQTVVAGISPFTLSVCECMVENIKDLVTLQKVTHAHSAIYEAYSAQYRYLFIIHAHEREREKNVIQRSIV